MNILTIAALVVAVLTGGPQAHRPAEDDARHQAVWAVAALIGIAQGYESPLKVYEPTRHPGERIVTVTTVWIGTECSLGTVWTSRTRAWTPLRWECP